MSNIIKNYYSVLEVIRSLNCELAFKIRIERRRELFNLKIVVLSFVAAQANHFIWRNDLYVENGITSIELLT